MNLVLVGVNHKSAPLEVRERLAIPPARLPEATQSLLSVPCVREGFILSTCNRVEIITYQEPAQADLLDFIRDYFAIDPATVRPYLYEFRASEVVRHLFRVAASLDSLVVGESQILGQVKQSYSVARAVGAVNTNLDPLLQRAFTVAKKVRTETNIGSSAISIASVAVQLASKIFGSLKNKTVLLVGTGKTGVLAARSLMQQGAGTIYVCNRTYEHAVPLAQQFGAQIVPFDELHEFAARADVVISSTGAQHPIFEPSHGHMYAQQRKQRPMFFIDIAVPRDVDPEMNRVEGIFVYSIDDLQSVAAAHISNRQKEAQDAEAIIRREVQRYEDRMHTLNAVPAIVAFQQSLEELRQGELSRLSTRLVNLTPEQRQAVELLTRSLVNKIQHTPIQAIKRAAREGDRETLAMIQNLFDVSESDQKQEADIEDALEPDSVLEKDAQS
ncbi:MAG TPA: glutamyl-tRNA reductase [Acidobacteriaceae bacterium]|nr:glutamyl-tRNA reductase [Acidobacteriaceae bacterium]